MRILHTIDYNTRKAYRTSPSAAQLLDEINRNIRANNLFWEDSIIDRLTILCIRIIAKNFERNPVLHLPPQDKDHLIELLSTDLPLVLTIPLLNDDCDDFYWKRCYKEKFSSNVNSEDKSQGQTWKSYYLERHIRKLCEEAQPQYEDEYTFNQILILCQPYVNSLIIKQLQMWKPPKTILKPDIPDADTFPIAHINLIPILKLLPNLQEMEISYGVRNVGIDYDPRMFKVAVEDCQRLGVALNFLKQLKYFKLTRSAVSDAHIKAFIRPLLDNMVLMELDLSYCQIKDIGAKCIGKMITVLTQLRTLNLRCNKIEAEGANSIAFGLTTATGSFLHRLDLSLNPLGYEGVMPICSALLRCAIPNNLSIAGCGIDEISGSKIGGMLKFNRSLRELDISNNYFGTMGGQAILLAMQGNSSLLKLNMKMTGIPADLQASIKAITDNNLKLFIEDIMRHSAPGNKINSSIMDIAPSVYFSSSQCSYDPEWASSIFSENDILEV